VDERGQAVRGDTLLLMMNAGEESIRFKLPALGGTNIWVVMLDTAHTELPVIRRGAVRLESHAVILLRYGSDRRISTHEEERRDPESIVEKHTP
jgi:isoamylase